MKRPILKDYNFGLVANSKVFTNYVMDWNEYTNLLKLEIKRLKEENEKLKTK